MNKTATIEPEIVTMELDRRCPTCDQLRLVTDFQDVPNGPVFKSCRDCRHAMVAQPQTDQGKEVRDFAKRLAAEARGEHIESPHITEINAEMQRKWGGVKGFCDAWFEQIQIAMVGKAGTKLILDQFVEQVRLAKYATELRGSAPDIASMTDEQLGKEMLKLAMSVIPEKLEGSGE